MIRLQDVVEYINTFFPSTNPEVLKQYRANIKVDADEWKKSARTEILPLLKFALRAPDVTWSFVTNNGWVYWLEPSSAVEELNKLIAAIDSTMTWRNHIENLMEKVEVNVHEYVDYSPVSHPICITYKTQDPGLPMETSQYDEMSTMLNDAGLGHLIRHTKFGLKTVKNRAHLASVPRPIEPAHPMIPARGGTGWFGGSLSISQLFKRWI